MAGKLVLCSLRRPRPLGCRHYIAGVRAFSYRGAACPGWEWNALWEDLGPPWRLLRRFLNWQRHGDWPARWPEYALVYSQWLAAPPGLASLMALRVLLDLGAPVALACWCDRSEHCHRSLIGIELTRRGYTVEDATP